MTEWLFNLPIIWMALVIFLGSYLVAAADYLIVMRLAVNDRVRAFKALSPGMLPPLGILFGLLVGFMAAQVWSDFERPKPAHFAPSYYLPKASPETRKLVFELSSTGISKRR